MKEDGCMAMIYCVYTGFAVCEGRFCLLCAGIWVGRLRAFFRMSVISWCIGAGCFCGMSSGWLLVMLCYIKC